MVVPEKHERFFYLKSTRALVLLFYTNCYNFSCLYFLLYYTTFTLFYNHLNIMSILYLAFKYHKTFPMHFVSTPFPHRFHSEYALFVSNYFAMKCIGNCGVTPPIVATSTPTVIALRIVVLH